MLNATQTVDLKAYLISKVRLLNRKAKIVKDVDWSSKVITEIKPGSVN